MKMQKFISVVVFLSLALISCGQSKKSYEISVKIPDLKDSTLFLAFHMGDKQYLKDTLVLDGNGSGTFSGRQELPGGIYMIVLPGRHYFEILVSDDQQFEVTCSYEDYFNTLKFTGSSENSAFLDYQKQWIQMQQKASAIARRLQNNKQNPDSLKVLSEKQKTQEEFMKTYLKKVIDENKGSLLASLIRALLPVDAPPMFLTDGVKSDSLKWIIQYNYNKDHFFDNIDLNDERLIRTPILQSKLKAFFTDVVIQSPDSVNREIDRLIAKCENNYSMFQFVSVFLFNHFRQSEIMGHDAVLVKLADDIYLSGRADWITSEFRDDLKKQIDLLRHNLIGMTAQNLIMDSYTGIFVSLFDIEKDFVILYFWEPDCGHCKEATPKLKQYYDEMKDRGVEVFSVCTTNDRQEWEKYIAENKLTWINGWDPQRATNYGYYYNVQSTPMIYILDRDKKIIAKKLSVDDIPAFIDNYRKYFRKSG